MSITVRLSGGIGNQLHQFAAGVAIAGVKKTNLILDLRTINLGSNQKRVFELDSLDFSKLTVPYSFLGSVSTLRNLIYRFRNKLNLPQSFYLGRNIIQETSEDPLTQIEKINDNDEVSGHFVDFNWVYKAEEFGFGPQIKENILTKEVIALKEKVGHDDVAIHMRFGDFLEHPDIFPKIDDDFFQEALSHLPKANHIWIFTDDLRNATKFCNKTIRKAFKVLGPKELSSIETFWLFGQFNAMITSNSTFSCWASYISNQANPQVITPTPHLLKSWTDSLPNSWLRIPLKLDYTQEM